MQKILEQALAEYSAGKSALEVALRYGLDPETILRKAKGERKKPQRKASIFEARCDLCGILAAKDTDGPHINGRCAICRKYFGDAPARVIFERFERIQEEDKEGEE